MVGEYNHTHGDACVTVLAGELTCHHLGEHVNRSEQVCLHVEYVHVSEGVGGISARSLL